MIEETKRPLEIILIHGTWASDATWPNKDGQIATALVNAFGDDVNISDMRWSGKNRQGDREAATEKLIHQVTQASPSQHILIAHSHAGNIASYAALDPVAKEHIVGTVTLATPFIVARRRQLGLVGTVVAQTLVLGLTLLFLYALNALWIGDWATKQKLWVFIAAIVSIEVPGLLLARRWANFAENFHDKLAHGLSPDSLIIRSVADEASRGIELLQTPSVIISLLVGKIAYWSDYAVTRLSQLVEKRPLQAALFFVLAIVVGVFPAFIVLLLTHSELAMLVALILFTSVTWGPIIFLFLRNRFLACVVAAFPIALLMMPLILIVGVAQFLALGAKFALANFYLDVSAEATPIGQFNVHLLSGENGQAPGSLQHSTVYDDPRAIALICSFVGEHLARI